MQVDIAARASGDCRGDPAFASAQVRGIRNPEPEIRNPKPEI